MKQWQGFKGKKWQEQVDVREFIQANFKEYTAGDEFLAGPTEATVELSLYMGQKI